MDANETVTIWLERLRGGDEDAVARLWQRYFDRILGLARARLGSRRPNAADEEDVAISVFDSFCRGIQAGKFPELMDRQGLWPLLVVLTIRKVCDYVNYDRRAKRGGGRVLTQADFGSLEDAAFDLDGVLNDEPTPEMLVIVEEECDRLFARLDDEQRRIAHGKLQGYTNQELAAQMNCGLRTIERRLDLIRRIWMQVEEGPATR